MTPSAFMWHQVRLFVIFHCRYSCLNIPFQSYPGHYHHFIPSYHVLSMPYSILSHPTIISHSIALNCQSWLALLDNFHFLPCYSYPCSVHDTPLATPSRCVLMRNLWTCSSVYRVSSTDVNDPLGNNLDVIMSSTNFAVLCMATYTVFTGAVYDLLYCFMKYLLKTSITVQMFNY